MDFDTGQTDICPDCGSEFELIGDNAIVENRCRSCQAKWRTKEAGTFHKRGWFPEYHNWWDFEKRKKQLIEWM